jgi:hypothetical protein
MNSKSSAARHFVAAVALTLVFCFATAFVPRPITGSFSGGSDLYPTIFGFGGNFDHLGRFSGQITSFTPTDTGGITTATWTAANGDTVDVTSIFTVNGFNPVSGLFIFHQDITVDGGTGRFEGATGEIDGDGETTLIFSFYFGVINGTIDY